MMMTPSHLLSSLAAGLLCLGIPGAARAADDAVTWQLRPELKVDASGIFLSQLVEPAVSSSAAHPPNVVLPHLRLAPAPSLGQTASFSRAQIIELAHDQCPELATTNWTGAAKTRVSRLTNLLTDSALVGMLTAALQRDEVKDRGTLELHLVHPLPPALIPEEGVTLKITDLPPTGVSPAFLLRCELWNGTEHVSDWQLSVQARVWREIPVAAARLTRGQLLQDAPVQMERRDLLFCRDAFLNFPSPDGNLELTETIPPGMPILNRSVRVRPVLLRGKIVDGIYADGALTISLKVETLEDGQPGQVIRLRNPKTKREIYGKVQNEQTVLLTL
jgi:flagella basal body P-ring formation protein FlgA